MRQRANSDRWGALTVRRRQFYGPRFALIAGIIPPIRLRSSRLSTKCASERPTACLSERVT